jgi:hypothetical protein
MAIRFADTPQPAKPKAAPDPSPNVKPKLDNPQGNRVKEVRDKVLKC